MGTEFPKSHFITFKPAIFIHTILCLTLCDVRDVCRHSIDLYSLLLLSCIQCTEEGGGCKWLFPAVPTALRQAVSALLHPAAELSSGNALCSAGAAEGAPEPPLHQRGRQLLQVPEVEPNSGPRHYKHLVLKGPLRCKPQIVCRTLSNFSYPQKFR